MGPAQPAYWSLTRTEALDYGRVMAAILYQLEISPEFYRQKFRAKKRPQLIAQNFRDVVERWIQPLNKTTAEVMDIIILE